MRRSRWSRPAGTSTRWSRPPPERLTPEFLDQHGISLVVHGDDLTAEAAAEVYGPAVSTGRLRLVPRATGLSTTEVIARVRDRRA